MTEQEAIRVLRERLLAVTDVLDAFGNLSDGMLHPQPWNKHGAEEKIKAARETLAATATTQPVAAPEPVRYEHRMRAPNGNCGDWHSCNKEFFDKFSAAPDIGDGFAYETRALYTAAPAPADRGQVLEEAIQACLLEKVDSEATQSNEDEAYNQAIAHCVNAIMQLKGKASTGGDAK
jgi:hypothetical protein